MNPNLINYILLGIIALIILFATWLFFALRDKKPKEIAKKLNDVIEENFTADQADKKSSKNKNKGKETQEVPQEKKTVLSNTLLDFDNIINDMIVSKKNTTFSMVIQCQGVNFDLMSDDEKFSIEQSFIELVKDISFPFKIHIQTRTLNFQNNIQAHEANVLNLEHEITEMVNKFNQMQAESAPKPELVNLLVQIQKKQRVYEYSQNLIKQIQALSNNNFTITKTYYIVISCTIEELGISGSISLEKSSELVYSELSKRSNIIIQGLQNSLVQASILKSQQLAELLYNTFNQDDENLFKLRNAIDSGMIRFFSSRKA